MLQETSKELIYQHFVDDLQPILRTAEDMARVGIIPTTETSVLNTYIELSLFYVLTIGSLIVKTEGYNETNAGEIESTFILSLISLNIGTASWQKEPNTVQLLERFSKRKPTYRQYWNHIGSESSPSELLQLLADNILEVGRGHAKNYEDKLFTQVFHGHTAKIVKMATASYEKVIAILSAE